MSGRYQIDSKNDGMMEYIDEARGKVKKLEIETGEVLPADIAPVIAYTEQGIETVPMIWGFLKWHTKSLVYNVRQEGALSKKLVAKSLMRRRIAIPATGFYEWKIDPHTKEKNKYLFTEEGKDILYFAGCYKSLKDKDFPVKQRFTVLTTAANSSMKTYCGRMPVLLHREEIEDWLSGENMFRYMEREQFPVIAKLVMANSGERAMNSI